MLLFGTDQIVELKAEVEGDEGNPFNKAWYQVEDGYTYSGWLQPVETRLHKPVYEIPVEGQLGEITVPVSETRLTPRILRKKRLSPVLRQRSLGEESTIVTRDEKSIWYEIYDSEVMTILLCALVTTCASCQTKNYPRFLPMFLNPRN